LSKHSAWVVNVEQADFEKAVIQRSREVPVVVDFWAPWCGPCRMLAPVLERLVEERDGEVLLAKVNIDNAQELALQYGISSIPAVVAFRDGQPVLDFVGVLQEPALRNFLDRISPSQADRTAKRAAQVETTAPAEAEKLYRQTLEQDRNNEAAAVGLARLLLAKGQLDEAGGLLEPVGSGGPVGAEAERLKGTIFLQRLAQTFGDEGSARRRLEKEPGNAEARYQLGCVLAAQGGHKEALEQLLAAAEADPKLAASKVREAMVNVFQVIGVRSAMADEYRDKLAALLY
jgi:putative thioredoxin